MKLPRDLDARKLVSALKARLGYEITRQEGSHIRLTTFQNGKHSVTVPAHDPIKVGTLARILDGSRRASPDQSRRTPYAIVRLI